MRIVHLTTYDSFGGAARATHRLHRALVSEGVDSHMLVRRRFGAVDERVHAPTGFFASSAAKLQRRLDAGLARIQGAPRQPKFSPAIAPDFLLGRIQGFSPDIIHLHWVNDGFLRIPTIASLQWPVVWTLHDMWPFTGGCHYAGNCQRFAESCGSCPILGAKRVHDLSRSVWEAKQRAYSQRETTIVAPSRWMGDQAAKSTLFKGRTIAVIPNGLDLHKFCPGNQEAARRALGLSEDKWVIMGGSVSFRHDPRKGFTNFEAICRELLALSPDTYQFVVFGGQSRGNFLSDGIEFTDLGTIEGDTRMAQAYAAAEIFLSVSLEDNLPNTIMESLACGTPVAAFSIGGVPDMVHDGENGVLENPDNPAGLARRIHDLLFDRSRMAKARQRATEGARNDYSPKLIAEKHKELYSALLAANT